MVYGVGREFKLGLQDVFYQCLRLIRWVFRDAGEYQVVVHASGLNVQYGFFHCFVFFYNRDHVFMECFEGSLKGVGLFDCSNF